MSFSLTRVCVCVFPFKLFHPHTHWLSLFVALFSKNGLIEWDNWWLCIKFNGRFENLYSGVVTHILNLKWPVCGENCWKKHFVFQKDDNIAHSARQFYNFLSQKRENLPNKPLSLYVSGKTRQTNWINKQTQPSSKIPLKERDELCKESTNEIRLALTCYAEACNFHGFAPIIVCINISVWSFSLLSPPSDMFSHTDTHEREISTTNTYHHRRCLTASLIIKSCSLYILFGADYTLFPIPRSLTLFH
jgi:hypothetical protein